MSPPTGADLHRGWLELVATEGPFLAVPALLRVWPQGMPAPDRDAIAALKDGRLAFEKAWENWDRHRDNAALEHYQRERDAWVELVLRDVLGWADSYTTTPTADPVRSPDHAVTVHATGSLTIDGWTSALVLVVDPVDSLQDPVEDGWANTPIDRAELLLRANSVPVGVVTDGRWWAIVSAPDEGLAASGVVDAQTWVEEPQTRDAFVELLRRRRLVSVSPDDRLPRLFVESITATDEITEALGTQVRRAVELLVQAMSEAALTTDDPDPLPEERSEVYEAAVTVMMRVVFLLFAEERGLLPETELFTLGYGISGQLNVLDERSREEGSESLDATHLTWHRLLATSRALYGGTSFEDIRIPSYGGSLFDPARFAFLTSCGEHGTLRITVSDRVMLEVLRAVQVATLKGQPARRISFRHIDVEQIGYIYEGLLGYSCEPAEEVAVGIVGRQGEEPEMPLAALESLAASGRGDNALAAAILDWVKENQPAATPPSVSKLARAIREGAEDVERALRAVTTDADLRDRLRPFVGIIRRDLRNRPLVVMPGGVLVVETPSRATAGAHYTPRPLAEEVVLHALQPLVYDPGPHQQPDGWELKRSHEILDLRVADIACGSGAFLVAAARFLAARLVEAWQREGEAVGTPQEVQTHAIRSVVAKCLYGADINAMAVEMCKLSLWLVSLDPKLPFSFVDDKILHGNSLLGLTDRRQLRYQHIDPPPEATAPLFEPEIDGTLRRAAILRGHLSTEVTNADPQRSATTKRRQWREYQALVAELTEIADAVVAAGLRHGGKPGKKLNEAYATLSYAISQAHGPDSGELLDGILEAGLTPTVTTDYERWKPLHWVLMVPDVLDGGGFDAIIGNPPFLGGSKITGAMGTNIRDWFVHTVANGTRGTSDLVAYFLLRAMSLLNEHGTLGLVATNTVAQGDTREVGLDRMVTDGFTITRAVQSRSWPVASASLEYAAVWGSHRTIPAVVPRVVDDVPVERISTLLEPAGRTSDLPVRLPENTGIAFKGCFVLGMGLVLEPEEAAAWIDADPANDHVLFPYLSGEDLNSRPETSPSRWIIDFGNRSEAEAQRYRLPYRRVYEQVRPERLKNKRTPRRERWWQFAEPALAMRKATARLDKVLVIALVSKTVMPMRVPTEQVFSHKLGVFATDSFADQAVLSSSLHQTWAVKHSSTMRTDVNYSPSDVFLTFPRPEPTERLAEVGRVLDIERREIMLRRELGLTKLYNLVNDSEIADSADADVARMRTIHTDLDHAVMAAYGWDDLPLDHGFHTYRQMTRWTVSPTARVEILDRLLEENHRRTVLQGEAPPADDGGDEE